MRCGLTRSPWRASLTEMARWAERYQLSLWPLAIVAELTTRVLSVWPATINSKPLHAGELRIEENLLMTSLARGVKVASPEAKVTSERNLTAPVRELKSTMSGLARANSSSALVTCWGSAVPAEPWLARAA